MWLESYGLTFIAGLCWILVGFFLLARASNWTGAVEGITLLPVAILFLQETSQKAPSLESGDEWLNS